MQRQSDAPRVLGLRPAAGWGVVLLVWLALQLTMGFVARTWPGSAANVLLLGACEFVVLGAAVLLLALRPPSGARGGPVGVQLSTLAAGVPAPVHVVVGFALGACFHPVAGAIRQGVEALWPTPEELLAHKLEVLRHDTLGTTLGLFFVVALLAPLLEELFYRGALYTRVAAASGHDWATLIASCGFVFAHGDARDWPSLLLVGVLLTWLRRRTGSIWASVVGHACFNGLTLFLLTTVGDVRVDLTWLVLGAVSGSGLLVWLGRTTRRVE